MSKVYAFIINYNRLGLPKKMYEYLSDIPDIIPVILDNNSSYEPLLEWYEKEKPNVERFKLNYGNCCIFNTGILDKYNLHGNFILTDPDLDISGIPKDFLHILKLGLDKYSWADKCGFSLSIDNLPDNSITQEVLKWETGYWQNPLDDMYFKAPIDTTFALFRTRMHSFECIRTNIPYCAKHMPWYWTKENIPNDEKYYINSVSSDFNFYSREIKKIIN